MEDYTQAGRYFQEAWKIDASMCDSLDGLACVEFTKGNKDRAIELWKKARKSAAMPEQRKRIGDNLEAAGVTD